MKLVIWVLALAACTAGDDTASGARGFCSEGGALTSCPDAAHTAQGACWRMVDCGAIAINSGATDNNFDWGQCVDRIEATTDVAAQLIIGCIDASSCDALKVNGSPDNPDENQMLCFHLGGR